MILLDLFNSSFKAAENGGLIKTDLKVGDNRVEAYWLPQTRGVQTIQVVVDPYLTLNIKDREKAQVSKGILAR